MTLEQLFTDLYTDLGYNSIPGVSVFPCPDPTTLFVSATISTLGHELNGANRPVSTVQECLRTQNLKFALDTSYDPEYLSSFTMLGLQAPLSFYRPEHITAWFDQFSGLRARTVIRTSQALTEYLFHSLEPHFEILRDEQPPEYYNWTYGARPLTGRGLTFSIRQPDGSLSDVGNLILLECNGQPIAFEYGFGVETFSARAQGYGTPYASSAPVRRANVNVQDPTQKRMIDALIIAWRLYSAGVKPGRGGASSVLRKALRRFSFALAMHTQSETCCGRTLAKTISPDRKWQTLVDHQLSQVEENLSKYHKNATHIARHVSGTQLSTKLRQYRARYGIPSELC